MPAYSSDHPEVIDFWTGPMQDVANNWIAVSNRVEEETGRKIYVASSSMGDGYPVGLGLKEGEMQPPPGWRWYQGAKNQIICPRAKGPGSKDAAAIMRTLNGAYPTPRRELHERFDAPAFLWIGLRVVTPGVHLWDGTLWMYYGEEKPEGKPGRGNGAYWDGGTHFTERKLSEFHMAREAAEAADVQPVE